MISLHDWVHVRDDVALRDGDHRYRGRKGIVVAMRTGCLSALQESEPLVTVKFDTYDVREFALSELRDP